MNIFQLMKTILITGASSGIGESLAWKLAADGYSLVLTARREEKLNIIARDIRVNSSVDVDVVPVDLAAADGADKLYGAVKKLKKPIYGLVNNAGFGDKGPFLSTGWTKFDDMISLNIRSLTQTTRLFLPEMVEQKDGMILNVASTAAFQAVPNMAVYSATKAYVLSFTEALSEELQGTGVSCLALCPGVTLSEFQKHAGMSQDEAVFKLTPVSSSESVAIYAARMIRKRAPVIGVHGALNRLTVGATKFLPRRTVRKTAKRMFED